MFSPNEAMTLGYVHKLHVTCGGPTLKKPGIYVPCMEVYVSIYEDYEVMNAYVLGFHDGFKETNITLEGMENIPHARRFLIYSPQTNASQSSLHHQECDPFWARVSTSLFKEGDVEGFFNPLFVMQ